MLLLVLFLIVGEIVFFLLVILDLCFSYKLEEVVVLFRRDLVIFIGSCIEFCVLVLLKKE